MENVKKPSAQDKIESLTKQLKNIIETFEECEDIEFDSIFISFASRDCVVGDAILSSNYVNGSVELLAKVIFDLMQKEPELENQIIEEMKKGLMERILKSIKDEH